MAFLHSFSMVSPRLRGHLDVIDPAGGSELIWVEDEGRQQPGDGDLADSHGQLSGGMNLWRLMVNSEQVDMV